MPSQQEHIEKARHNERFFSSFDVAATPFLDWVVNGIFYSALQYLDCYFANKGKHPDTHSERIREIWNESHLGRPFFLLYRPLKDDSEEGRYHMRVFHSEEVGRDVLPLLSKIKTHLKKFIPEI